MEKETLEFLLNITNSCYLEYIEQLKEQSFGDRISRTPLMGTYDNAIAELKEQLKNLDKQPEV